MKNLLALLGLGLIAAIWCYIRMDYKTDLAYTKLIAWVTGKEIYNSNQQKRIE